MSASSPLRLGLLIVALAAAIGVLVFAQVGSDGGLTRLPYRDFVEYWAAGQLLAGGENPYDVERVAALERQAGRDEDAILMWNPPWTLPLVLPLGYLPVRAAHVAWLLLQTAVLFAATEWLWRHYRGPADGRLLAHLLAWTFVPTSFAVLVGQISPLLLLGAVAFLALVRRGRDTAAGAACALLAIKPHLVYLFWPAVIVWAVTERRWRVLIGGALAGVALTAVAMTLRPTVLADYWHTFTTRPPEQYRSPTLGTLVRLAVGEGAFRWQFLAVLPGFVWLAVWWPRRTSRDWDVMLPLILLVSLLTTPYGAWLFDLVLLLVPVVAVAAGVGRSGGPVLWAALAVHLAVNGLALALWMREVEYLAFIWMTPVLLIAYLALRPRVSVPVNP